MHSELGEACHSRAGAWQQATERYAGACRIAERVASGELATVRLLDVGTGLGLNLAAALAAASRAPLHALSLECDPEVIARGLALYERPELRRGPWERSHAVVRAALRAALAQPGAPVPLGERGTLELRLGDARATLDPAGPVDAVFLDPFSPQRAGELWDDEFLARIARTMASGAWLSTYSAAVRVRIALTRAGLRVGRGPRVGAKSEGTVASPDREPPPLPARLARRLAERARASPTV